MSQRAVEIAGFLTQNGWDKARPTAMEADFSLRRYARLERDDGKHAILMDADPEQKTFAFVAITKLLRRNDITTPEIFAADPMRGLVLMEDFGDRNFGRMIDGGTGAAPLYRRAVDVLVHLHRTFDKSAAEGIDLPVFGGALFATQAELFLDAYIPYTKGREATLEESEGFHAAWKQALKGIETMPQSLLLRDYMPDNLMDLAGREGVPSVGVLDFQDAGHGPIAYDIASLCEAVRRDGGDMLLDEMISYYHRNAKPSLSIEDLRTACRVLAAQRHMRILGIIVQLAQKTGRKDKLAWLPRIQKYLKLLLEDEKLKPVQAWMAKIGC